MSNNISIQINEINRLMNYDRSKSLLEQPDSFMDRKYGISSRNAKELGMNIDEYEKLVFHPQMTVDELASALCGDNSPFAGLFKIPWIEYKSEELLCDVLAGLLMAFGPVGIAAGMSIEFLHAKDLWNKGDKIGAVISMTIGLIPVIGDAAGKGLRILIQKLGTSGISKVARIMVLMIKFLSGEVKASTLIRAKKALSADERLMLYNLLSTGGDIFSKVSKLGDELGELASKLEELNIPFLSDSVKKIQEVLNTSSIFSTLGDAVAQTSSIMSAVFGMYFVGEVLTCDPSDNSFEAFDQQIEDSYNMLEDMGDEEFNKLLETDLKSLGIEVPIKDENTNKDE